MDMRVSFQFLTPTVQQAEKADFRAETFGITSDFQKGFRTAAKQEVVDDLLACSATPAGPDDREACCGGERPRLKGVTLDHVMWGD